MVEDNREKERQEYEESLKAYRDWYSVTKTSFDKGKAEGIEQGRAEGIEQGRAEGIQAGILMVAKNMKEQGRDLKEIAKVTALPISEIERL